MNREENVHKGQFPDMYIGNVERHKQVDYIQGHLYPLYLASDSLPME